MSTNDFPTSRSYSMYAMILAVHISNYIDIKCPFNSKKPAWNLSQSPVGEIQLNRSKPRWNRIISHVFHLKSHSQRPTCLARWAAIAPGRHGPDSWNIVSCKSSPADRWRVEGVVKKKKTHTSHWWHTHTTTGSFTFSVVCLSLCLLQFRTE